MLDKYLLYIDILGFRNLARTSPDRVYDLYRVVASLNVHRHSAFAAIVFSDTVVIYNTSELVTGHDRAYTVMSLCEFAQDLLHRLIGRDIAFRAVLTVGPFEHYYLNEVPCFFGTGLIEAYDTEKSIKATGLFINKSCLPYNQIYPTAPLDDIWNFVFLTQRMSDLEEIYDGLLPLVPTVAVKTDMGLLLGLEVLHLKTIYDHAENHPDTKVRAKYAKTWSFYAQRYPTSTETLIAANFSLSAVSPDFDWQPLLDRTPEDFDWASRRRNVSTPER
jgi:hypothetical protein